MTRENPIDAAIQRYQEAKAALDQAKEAFFDTCAQEVLAGRETPDTIAARGPLSAVTIRKALRDRGVDPLPRGRKPNATSHP